MMNDSSSTYTTVIIILINIIELKNQQHNIEEEFSFPLLLHSFSLWSTNNNNNIRKNNYYYLEQP